MTTELKLFTEAYATMTVSAYEPVILRWISLIGIRFISNADAYAYRDGERPFSKPGQRDTASLAGAARDRLRLLGLARDLLRGWWLLQQTGWWQGAGTTRLRTGVNRQPVWRTWVSARNGALWCAAGASRRS